MFLKEPEQHRYAEADQARTIRVGCKSRPSSIDVFHISKEDEGDLDSAISRWKDDFHVAEQMLLTLFKQDHPREDITKFSKFIMDELSKSEELQIDDEVVSVESFVAHHLQIFFPGLRNLNEQAQNCHDHEEQDVDQQEEEEMDEEEMEEEEEEERRALQTDFEMVEIGILSALSAISAMRDEDMEDSLSQSSGASLSSLSQLTSAMSSSLLSSSSSSFISPASSLFSSPSSSTSSSSWSLASFSSYSSSLPPSPFSSPRASPARAPVTPDLPAGEASVTRSPYDVSTPTNSRPLQHPRDAPQTPSGARCPGRVRRHSGLMQPRSLSPEFDAFE